MFWISWKPPSRTPKPLEAAAVPSVWVIRSFTLTLLRNGRAFVIHKFLEFGNNVRSSPTSQEFRQCETSAVAVSDRAFGATAWSFCSRESERVYNQLITRSVLLSKRCSAEAIAFRAERALLDS
jgi:hypothetical protein